ncbi:MAG: helix-turn-helix transcriptional regulator [Synergistota bacterium]|jgi:transcriptional regulator with XRE-family HTH domain|nr:helix-turn-helix transcriptional regulator [Synergistota bacterium]
MSLLYYRIKANLSQSRLAELMGVSENKIVWRENYTGTPDFDLEKKLAAFFGVEIKDLRREKRYPKLTKDGLVRGLDVCQTVKYLRALRKFLGDRDKPVIPLELVERRRREWYERKVARSSGGMRNGADGDGTAAQGGKTGKRGSSKTRTSSGKGRKKGRMANGEGV